ncbi:MAG: 1,4-alpha-glucan branching protein GlgB [Gammaproteobacteria bacterium]|nr:1,4-alpha-glucan branching protein GlgB [Gammaproteobacteria bacterium]MCF6230775.1 1,4-alpha-glucan branching protein GlgB [Gammaproteobacteria bacterium]
MKITQELQKIIDARHHDPFKVLGRHPDSKGREKIVVYLPEAEQVSLPEINAPLKRISGSDFFIWQGKAGQLQQHYSLTWLDAQGVEHTTHDPYCFAPQLAEFDIHLFSEGKHWHLYRVLGANHHQIDNIEGMLFAVWAPNAERVSVVGDFNNWDGRTHSMRNRGGCGLWEIFIPAVSEGNFYKFEIRNRESGEILTKTDPYGKQFQLRPETAAIIPPKESYPWQDHEWKAQNQSDSWLHDPCCVYEVHLGSWQQSEDGKFLNYRDLAYRLAHYAKEMGFTHIELLPITEHPLDASWGYQTTGYFAPTSRFGTPDDFRYFVDYCHQQGVGVILDWVPAHFPKDRFALARFDGTPLYEHEDPRKGEHRDWGTLIYNFGRNEVKNFLLASAVYWLEEFHIDGLRVDAVASMLYLDYSREAGDWIPNKFGGRENLEAIDFLRELNTITHSQCPGTFVIAEESTAWPQVTRPTYLGGLGFSMKWNMGWMHDTLEYFSQDPVYRTYHHDKLTFGLLYSFTENFMLPFSHDEVVHGKKSMLNKMPGDEWQRCANLRLLYTYMYTYPGKKLLFMGCEFGQGIEWNHAQSLEWPLLEHAHHQGIQSLVKDLNHLYRQAPPLHHMDFQEQGFEWIDCHDSVQSVISYQRSDGHQRYLIILNCTPVPREGYRLGVPDAGRYREVINSDSTYYGGSNLGNGEIIQSEQIAWMGQPHSINLTLPPLAALVLTLNQE